MLNLTKVGTCPTCRNRVERSYTDIFFPYCGYTCKRVVQRKEEEAIKSRIALQEKKYEEFLIKERERRERAKIRKELKEKIELVQNRIATCAAEYSKNSEEAVKLPKSCEKRWRAQERANSWYKKMVKAQIELNELQKKGEDENDSGRQADSNTD